MESSTSSLADSSAVQFGPFSRSKYDLTSDSSSINSRYEPPASAATTHEEIPTARSLADSSAVQFGPFSRSKYDLTSDSSNVEPVDSAAAKQDAASTPRPASSRPSSARPRTKSTIATVGSTVANAGSTNGYGSQAPFGSAQSRFSPSMSMAHHVSHHKPALANPTTSRGTRPNRRWLPKDLQADEDGEASCAAKTHVEGAPSKPNAVPQAARCAVARPHSARSAGEEQRISRQLRAEITAMRDEKLAQLREPDNRRPVLAGKPSPRCVVDLEAIHGGSAVLRTAAHAATGAGERGEPLREISAGYASLLEFVAGESRRR